MKAVNPKIALELAATLQDWIPMSDTRALRWAADLLECKSEPTEHIQATVRRIEEAAKRVARASRDVRYHDVYAAVCWLIKREVEVRQQERLKIDQKALPAFTGGVRTGNIAVGIFTDIASKLIHADAYESEFELRRGMTDEQIVERRARLSDGPNRRVS